MDFKLVRGDVYKRQSLLRGFKIVTEISRELTTEILINH